MKLETASEPPLLLAVDRPQALALLLHAGAAVDASNAFGKTALMAAAQFGDLESVRLLLRAGASVNATTLPPEKVKGNDPRGGTSHGGCEFYGIKHGERTALMYAASNAPLSVIETLLSAGADSSLKDSEGSTALDYLLGRGPVLANPLLQGAELEKAKGLLSK
jgi:ankyrin repeat protein